MSSYCIRTSHRSSSFNGKCATNHSSTGYDHSSTYGTTPIASSSTYDFFSPCGYANSYCCAFGETY